MLIKPLPTQLSGCNFLANRQRALLADEPRVGKTGAAIMAADKIQASRILIVTTASGRGVWRAALPLWSPGRPRPAIFGVDNKATVEKAEIVIASWAATPKILPSFSRQFGLIILDEDHYAKTPFANRTVAVYGWLDKDGETLYASQGVVDPSARVWHLTGSPYAHDLGDGYMRLRASCPERLLANPARGWPDVLTYGRFRDRYCVIRMKRLRNNEWIQVVVNGKNEDELRARVGDFMLRRTQEDVGIMPPVRELLPLIVSPSDRKKIDTDPDMLRVLKHIDNGTQSEDDVASVRRITGMIKVPAVIRAVIEEFDGGLNKIVLAYWHKDIGDALAEGLKRYGVARIDGSTPTAMREIEQARFKIPGCNVFLAQIIAAGESIDLSAADVMWIVEHSFTPKDLQQMAMRICNVNKRRNTFVKLVTLADSIDEAIQRQVLNLSFSIDAVTS
jgi:SWI/SNF-related matrix-associated actin-dependent regulator 1 of chromatin subfamily A